MLDSCNFVLYNSDSEIIWQSFENPTDTLLSGQILETGKDFVSAVSESNHSSGTFQLRMQTDGNLVQYLRMSNVEVYHAYWASKTNGKGSQNTTLKFEANDNLYMYNTTSSSNIKTIHSVGWGHKSGNVTYRLTIDADGILRLYSHSIVQVNSNWNIEWNSSNNRCDPTGVCGMNAYCVLEQNQQPNSDNRDKVSLEEFYEVLWEKNYYSIVPKNSRIACEQDCLKDCQCEIAVYTSNTCNKLRLPLRYAKPDQRNINVVTMVKVLKQSSEATTTWVTKGRSERVRNRFLISSVVCIVFSFIFLLLSMFLCCRRNFHSHTRVYRESNREILKVEEVLTVRSFTSNELEIATNFFMEPLGKGSFGTVFKGTLRFPDGERAIAVKRLEKVAVEGEVEFLNEMRSIGRTHHKNLVRLLGYCHENSNRLLVYDYMSHGSLSNFLFKSETKPHWNDRVKIALGIACGILYLHEDCENKIIHCDINPNNILIDENCDAKIADFGLAKLLMPDQTRTHTGIRGTRGFVAPEWHKGQPITTKADVYSFGIVLLVIICCRPGVDGRV
uniref:non-specific serine/threonine protein kinase n=1 Tax=Cannabis sativa TaxID=3483 RepID=A0A803NHG2_CANSA